MELHVNNNISLNEFYELMEKHEVIMVYGGEFSQDMTKSFLAMAETTFHNIQANETVVKKVYNIMMEALQNICKHEFKITDECQMKKDSIFMIAENNNEYQVITGNVIKPEILEIIKSKIDTVNALDQEGLKAMYKEARLNSTISSVGGAGLGFIDIARKSGNRISYHFSPVEGGLYYFIQMVTVTK
ncbi:MAG: SiaB family protein kinase [Bacteroidetes bacterium]|nr:SiaB family protein kinase [Bacteroidota bacterium]